MGSSFEDLDVWQIGKDITMEIYGLTAHFPKEESFALVPQIRKAALSVPANIAEGFGRYHYLDKVKFYLNARGSLYELKSHLLIAQELGYFNQSQSSSTSDSSQYQLADGIFDTIDKLSLKLNNLISKSRKLNEKSR